MFLSTAHASNPALDLWRIHIMARSSSYGSIPLDTSNFAIVHALRFALFAASISTSRRLTPQDCNFCPQSICTLHTLLGFWSCSMPINTAEVSTQAGLTAQPFLACSIWYINVLVQSPDAAALYVTPSEQPRFFGCLTWAGLNFKISACLCCTA